MAFIQDFFTSRHNVDGTTTVGQIGRLWYDADTNTIRVGDGTAGGTTVAGGFGGGGAETDPVFTASPAFGIVAQDITNWDTAHGWGNHSLAGYADTTTIQLTGGTVNQVLVKQTGADYDYLWEDLITYEPVYTKELDDTSTVDVIYIGEAAPNSTVASAVWRIQEIIFDSSGNADSVRYAGTGVFDQVWNSRVGLTYT